VRRVFSKVFSAVAVSRLESLGVTHPRTIGVAHLPQSLASKGTDLHPPLALAECLLPVLVAAFDALCVKRGVLPLLPRFDCLFSLQN
jgi:hypothetical protein